jgi:D-erythrulose 4-kinase
MAVGLMVATLLAELPDGVTEATGQRAGLLLNGLGAVKYEELFVVHRRVAQLLAGVGVEIVEPEVGELCTSPRRRQSAMAKLPTVGR